MTAPTLQSQLRLLLRSLGYVVFSHPGRKDYESGKYEPINARSLARFKTPPPDVLFYREPESDFEWDSNEVPDVLASEEVGLVLGWLAKAGYTPQVDSLHKLNHPVDVENLIGEFAGYSVNLFGDDPDIPEWIGRDDTLEAALTAAVLKPPLEAEVTG